VNRGLARAMVGAALWIALSLGTVSFAFAGALFHEAATVSTGAAPVEQTFTPTLAQAGLVDVTVTDLQFPVALGALRVAVTQDATVIKTASADGGVPASIKVTFTASAGVTYTIRVVGRPDATTGSGTAVVAVMQSGTPANQYASFPAAFQAPGPGGTPAPINVQTHVSLPTAGSYTATLTDLALPGPVPNLSAAVFPLGAGAPIATMDGSGTPVTFQVTAAGSYPLVILGTPGAAGGLYSLRIQGGPTNALVYPPAGASAVTAVGPIAAPVPITVAAGAVTLAAVDLALPASLTTLGAALTDPAGALVARQCAPQCGVLDPPSATVPAESLQLWAVASAGAGGGSYLTSVSQGGATVYSHAESVPPAAATSGSSAFVFPFNVTTAGSYDVVVTDLLAPSALGGLQFAVFQGASLVSGGASMSAGKVTVTLSAKPAEVHVVATLASPAGAGLFGVQASTSGVALTPVLSQAQAVGTFTASRKVSVGSSTAGAYAFTLTDGQWPKAFQTLDLFITQGASIVGKIYGGGTIPLTLAAGDYQVTYSAVPDAVEVAGLYAIDVSAVPAATASLAVDATSIASGQSVKLSWTSTNATGCTASDGWSGSQPTSSTGVTEGPLTATTKFTLVCNGPGGASPAATVTVNVSPPSGGSGGGGAFDPAAVLGLALLLAARGYRRVRSAAGACAPDYGPARI
jgi:hypothetical protein